MDNQKHSGHSFLRGRIFAALLAGIVLIPAARAQPAGRRPVENRFLLIFDTSAEMKRRVPAVQKTLDALFLTSFIEQLQPGDSIGLWTFDKDLHTGQLPLVNWMPSEAAAIAGGINSFVETQHYANTTRFDALQPLLNEVVTNSERLTVLIFFDGETAVSGTPYDDKINQILPQRQAERKKARQPFVIVLRVQLGRYVGCTLDFPPTPLSFPDFPPLPPPPPAPPIQPPPAPPKRVVMQSIIMINTNSETKPPPVAPSPIRTATNEEANPPPAPKLEMTNSPLPVAPTNPVPETNAVSAPEKMSTAPTNRVAETNLAAETGAVFTPAKIPAAQTNAPPLMPEESGLGGGGALAIGGTLLAAAGGLTVFILRRSRQSGHASLITRSMRKK
ncbi:MAG TPA: hypothetical protein VMV89_09910 [Candidatus Paceibacterota bacterium]|nr:hypothetical protein [Candidatus Paceibacterota bacterium]